MFTSLLAMCSGGYALFVAFQAVQPAVLFALLWGGTIFNIDRSIVQGIRKNESSSKHWQVAFPRIVLAIFIGLTVSKPLELKVFEPEIDAWLQEQNLKSSVEAQKEADQAFPRIKQLDSEIQDLKKDIREKRAELSKARQNLIEEEEGTGGTKKAGQGPAFETKKIHQNLLAEELKGVEFSNGSVIQEKEGELRLLVVARDQRLKQLSNAKDRAKGLLARINALHELGKTSPAIGSASWAITLLLIMVEVAPILSKLLMPRGSYDAILSAKEMTILKQADLETECLMLEMTEGHVTTGYVKQSIRDLTRAQFQEALEIAATSPESRKTIDQLAKSIAEQATQEILDLSANTYVSRAQVKKSVEEAIHEELKDIARSGVKKRFVKSRLNNLVERGILDLQQELNNFVNQTETQGEGQ